MSAQRLLSQRLERYKQLERRQKRSFDLISNLRLVVVIAGIAAAAMAGYTGTIRQAVYTGLPFLLVFIYLIYKHRQVEDRLNTAGRMAKINQDYLDRLNGDWVQFTDQGLEFADFDHPYSNDLNIFGPKSLFQWLSIAQTYLGRQQLQQLLAHPPRDIDAILARQRAVKELAGRLDFCQGLECRGLITPKQAATQRSW